MKLSQSATYAVHAALELAKEQNSIPVSCGKLAEKGHMPERFLLQILRDLAKQGILQSSRGGGGGFMLDRDPHEISLLQLIEAIDGPVVAGYPANSHLPDESSVVLRGALNRIAQTTRDQLSAITLAHLLEMPKPVFEEVTSTAGAAYSLA